MQGEVNYEALGRYTYLKQQRDALRLRLQAMNMQFCTLQFMLKNTHSEKNGRPSKSIDAVLHEVAKIDQELSEMTEEMAALAKKYNLGGNS